MIMMMCMVSAHCPSCRRWSRLCPEKVPTAEAGESPPPNHEKHNPSPSKSKSNVVQQCSCIVLHCSMSTNMHCNDGGVKNTTPSAAFISEKVKLHCSCTVGNTTFIDLPPTKILLKPNWLSCILALFFILLLPLIKCSLISSPIVFYPNPNPRRLGKALKI